MGKCRSCDKQMEFADKRAWQCELCALWDVLAAKDAEIAELKKDAERIDWLAKQFKTSTIYMDGKQPWLPTGYKLRTLVGSTFRDAIDAAIGKE